jgi:UDP-glucuronate decarboxylase
MSRITALIREDADSIGDEIGSRLRALQGTTLLVTGGNGFFCGYLLDVVASLNDRMFSQPCRVVSIDNNRTGLPERVAHLADRSEFTFVASDVSRPLQIDGDVDWLVHGASIASPTLYRRFPLETIDANVNGVRNALELARAKRCRGFLSLSTSEVYGDPDPAHVPTTEDYRGFVSCTGPRACYDESKRLGETLCMIYGAVHDLPVKIVRPFNVYGPGQRLDDGRVIPDLMAAAVNRRPIAMLSDGSPTRAFCYVADAVRAILLLLVAPVSGEAFNVGNDQAEVSMRDLAETLREVAGGPPWLEIEYRASEDRHYLTDSPQRRCPDLSKVRATLGWEPRVSLSEGLRRTLESYRELEAKAGR